MLKYAVDRCTSSCTCIHWNELRYTFAIAAIFYSLKPVEEYVDKVYKLEEKRKIYAISITLPPPPNLHEPLMSI